MSTVESPLSPFPNSSVVESTNLLNRLRQAPNQTVAEEFSRHRTRLACIVRARLDARLHGRVDTDDILQEAYLAATARIHHYLENPRNSFFIWLRLVVSQTLVDVHRRHLGAQRRSAERELPIHRRGAGGKSDFSLASRLLGQLTSPSGAAVREELAQQLEEALEQLNTIDREVLMLRHFEELSNSEVAEVLGIQQKAASIRYIRALSRLKTILENCPSFRGFFLD